MKVSNISFGLLTIQQADGKDATIYYRDRVERIRVANGGVFIYDKKGDYAKHQLSKDFSSKKAQKVAENFFNAPNEVHRIDVEHKIEIPNCKK